MKLEFISLLEREYHMTQNVKNFKVSLEYATLNNDRIMLVTKCKYFLCKNYCTFYTRFFDNHYTFSDLRFYAYRHVREPSSRFLVHSRLALGNTKHIFYTYIHNWSLQPFLLFVLVLYMRKIFNKLFMAILFTLKIFAKSLLRGSRQRNIFSYFVLLKKSDLTSDKITHNLYYANHIHNT